MEIKFVKAETLKEKPDVSKIKFGTHFTDYMFEMDYNDPVHKEIMDMEGLTKWVPGRLQGYEQITNADAYLGGFLKKFNASR